MTFDWRSALAKQDDLTIDGDAVEVALRNGRSHRVEIQPTHGALLLRALVCSSAASLPAAGEVWRRNARTPLVGFRVDRTEHLVAETTVPTAGLTHDELDCVVHVLAQAADRLEQVQRGEDLN